MEGLLYCYYGEMNGEKKIAVPRIYGGYRFNGEYDIYTMEMEKSEDDIRGKYVLKHDADAVYNRRNFNAKKYKFNSVNVKHPNTLKRTFRILIVELENKTSISFGGKIVSESPLVVENGVLCEIARNYEFNDSTSYINKICNRYFTELPNETEDEESVEGVWEEERLTIEDLELNDLAVEFLGVPEYSEGSSKFLGYNDDIGVASYDEGEAEKAVYEALVRKKVSPIFGVVINKDSVSIIVNDRSYKIPKRDGWKKDLGMLIRDFTNRFKIEYMVILQLTEERILEGQKQNIFHYIVRSESIYNVM